MIKQVDITEINQDENLFLTKIKANAICYNKFDFCSSYLQTIDGKQTALINVLSANATVFANENALFSELCEFLKFKGVVNIFCNKLFAEKTGLKITENGLVLKFLGKTMNMDNILKPTFNPNYKSIYSLLKNEFEMPDYNEFVSDLSYRLQKGLATVVSDEKGVAFTLWETENAAVISALSVDITLRRQGVGSRILHSLISALEKKQIYVYCEEKLKNFYIKNGFEIIDEYFVGKDFKYI